MKVKVSMWIFEIVLHKRLMSTTIQKQQNIEKYLLFLFGFRIMPTEVALFFNNDAGLLLFVDVPALFVDFCVVDSVCKKL